MSESVYLIGESRTNLDNAITKIFNSFYLAFEVDPETDQILQFGCTHTVDLTETFLSRLFVGQNLWERKSKKIREMLTPTPITALTLNGYNLDRKSTRLNSSHEWISRMPSSA